MRPPWESEEAAFSLLLRVIVVCAVIVALALLIRTIF
jgi:hypothetical protein